MTAAWHNAQPRARAELIAALRRLDGTDVRLIGRGTRVGAGESFEGRLNATSIAKGYVTIAEDQAVLVNLISWVEELDDRHQRYGPF